MNIPVPVVCEYRNCGKPIPPREGKPGNPRKYCRDANCRQLEWRAQKADVARAAKPPKYNRPLNRVPATPKSQDGRGSARVAPDWFVDEGWADRALDPSDITHGELATEILAAHPELDIATMRTNLSRWKEWWRQQQRIQAGRKHWKPPAEAVASLDDFAAFDLRYFEVEPGKPYHMKDFHLRWVGLLTEAYVSGSQVAIVTAPRQGKSELLIRFLIWLICKDPNIRILWVAKSQGLAERMVGMVKRQLESNEKLIEDFCGPGGTFKPPFRGGKWTDEEFVVNTRTLVRKSPTMVALGSGGTIIGRDADFIVGDDIEDDGTTATEKGREDTIRWWQKDLRSRKKAHTGWAYIGSRQHPEDLIHWLIENPRWLTDITPVHDPACSKPWDVPEHVEAEWGDLTPVEVADRRNAWLDTEHWDCVIFPEEFPFSYLKDTRESTQNDAIFEMQWLANPRPEGVVHFERDVVEACRELRTPLGKLPDGEHIRLIAGVDPAPKRMQAAILWAVDTAPDSDTFGHRWLVDIENQQAGGVIHMRSLMRRWSEKYPELKDWVVEENIVSDTLRHDVPIQEIRDLFSLNFIPHETTGKTKWDPDMGVTTMSGLFRDRKVHLAFGDDGARRLVGQYVHQLVNWDPRQTHSRNKARKSDLVMAGWFPEKTIQGWLREFDAMVRLQHRTSRSQWSTGFRGDISLTGHLQRGRAA